MDLNDSLRIPRSLIRQLNFTQNDQCATSAKNKFHYLEKIICYIVHMYVKLGLQFRYAVEQFSWPFFKVIFSYGVELSSKLFHCISFWLSVPINLPFSCDTTFPGLCSGFCGIPVKFTFSLAARSSDHEERRLAARGLSGIRLNLLGLNESRTSGLSLS